MHHLDCMSFHWFGGSVPCCMVLMAANNPVLWSITWIASVVGHRRDYEYRAEDLCSLSADLARETFHYAPHCVMFGVAPVHSVHTADGQGVLCYSLLHDLLAREALPY